MVNCFFVINGDTRNQYQITGNWLFWSLKKTEPACTFTHSDRQSGRLRWWRVSSLFVYYFCPQYIVSLGHNSAAGVQVVPPHLQVELLPWHWRLLHHACHISRLPHYLQRKAVDVDGRRHNGNVLRSLFRGHGEGLCWNMHGENGLKYW